MSKRKTVFECIECGHQDPKWLGRCPSCGAWNTMEEIQVSAGGSGKTGKASEKSSGLSSAGPVGLVSVNTSGHSRIDSGIAEVNRVLGGGIMSGSSILLGGEPGIGKSTLMMQIAGAAGGENSFSILYISGEESASQLRMRAERIGALNPAVQILIETDLDRILETLDKTKPDLLVMDSIQTITSEEAGRVPGTVNQVKYCGHELISWCKNNNAAIFFIAHVTKGGVIAGPKIIEHMVDTVLYFDNTSTGIRIVRAVKNRFGSVDEIGLFRMGQGGLVEVKDPSSLFLVSRDEGVPPGIVAVPVFEGTRAIMVEIQALTVPSKSGFTRIYSDKIDNNRISRIAAVIEKNLNLRFSDHDIYVNVAGGMKLDEVGIELAVACALYSARTGIPVPDGTAMAGEISLAGEIRPTGHMDRRQRTAADMGFKSFYGPAPDHSEKGHNKGTDTPYTVVSTISGSIQSVFGKRKQTG